MFDTPLSRRAFLGLGLALPLASCGYEEPHVDDGIVRVTLCTNGSGVFDQGFNELMWKGLKMLEEEDGWKVNYLEAAQIRDAYTNLDKAVDDGAQLVWLGGANPDPIQTVADQNVDVKFAMLDGVNETGLDNVVAVMFKSEEGSFIVGYIAARMSKTGKVGFIGGIANDTLLSFMYGYMAGIDYANAERATQVTCTTQWAESFSDASKGKSIAKKMIADDIDVIFVAAGGTGFGVIEGCDEAGIYVIGVDMDQSYLAPNTVITSCLKRADIVVAETSRQFIADEIEGGQTIYVGIAEGAVGIPEHHELIPDDIYNDTMALYALFEAGEMKVPVNKKEYEAYTPEIVI
jgi:basic membrane protein A